MTRLDARAREQLAAAGVEPAAWAQGFSTSGDEWRGDACGCPDERCAGLHHAESEPCGCLAALLAEHALLPDSVPAWADCSLTRWEAGSDGSALRFWERAVVDEADLSVCVAREDVIRRLGVTVDPAAAGVLVRAESVQLTPAAARDFAAAVIYAAQLADSGAAFEGAETAGGDRG